MTLYDEKIYATGKAAINELAPDIARYKEALVELKSLRNQYKKALIAARSLYEVPGIGIYEQGDTFRQMIGGIVTKYWETLNKELEIKKCIARSESS